MPGCKRAIIDKDHIRAREALIPAAEAKAREVAGQCQPALYARIFSLEMQRLAFAAGLIDYDPDQVKKRRASGPLYCFNSRSHRTLYGAVMAAQRVYGRPRVKRWVRDGFGRGVPF